MSDRSELAAAYVRNVPQAFEHDGIILPGALFTVEGLMAMKDQEYKPNDVIVTSYPKCGTTWVSEAVSCVLHDGNLDIVNRIRNHERVLCIEFNTGLWEKPIETESCTRCYSTHVPWRFLPTQAQQGGCKVINVSRNPKDAAVSSYHFHRMAARLGKQSCSWDQFFDLFTAGQVFYGSWFDYYIDFYKAGKDNKHILFLKYEDMMTNFNAELERICIFLDKKLTAEARAAITEHCQFSSMQNNPMTNRIDADYFDQEISKFVRKGIVGDWKNYFTPEQNEVFKKMYEERMAGSGLEFDFELN